MIEKPIINMQTSCNLTSVKLPTQAYSSSDYGIVTNAN
jgi:hypothetical protein